MDFSWGTHDQNLERTGFSANTRNRTGWVEFCVESHRATRDMSQESIGGESGFGACALGAIHFGWAIVFGKA
jgi:hypothetical protein